MGSSSSKIVASSATSHTVQEVQKQDPTISPEEIKACEAAIHDMLDEQLDAMKEEVKEVEELITDDVINTIKSRGFIATTIRTTSRLIHDRDKHQAGV